MRMIAVALAICASCVMSAAASAQHAAKPNLGRPVVSHTWSGTDSGGYRIQLSAKVYKLHPASSIPALPFSRRSRLVACSINPQTDAVIPVAIVLRNLTPRFSTSINLRFGPSGITLLKNIGSDQQQDIDADLSFSTGGTCSNPEANASDYGLVSWPRPVAPGASVKFDFFMVILKYFSPAHPHGYRALLSDLQLGIGVAVGPQGNESGVVFKTRSPLAGPSIPFLPGTGTPN